MYCIQGFGLVLFCIQSSANIFTPEEKKKYCEQRCNEAKRKHNWLIFPIGCPDRQTINLWRNWFLDRLNACLCHANLGESFIYQKRDKHKLFLCTEANLPEVESALKVNCISQRHFWLWDSYFPQGAVLTEPYSHNFMLTRQFFWLKLYTCLIKSRIRQHLFTIFIKQLRMTHLHVICLVRIMRLLLLFG